MSAFIPGFPSLKLVDDSGDRPIFELLADFSFQSDKLGLTITVPTGYRSDLCSIPKEAMALIGYPGGRAGIVHDYICTSKIIPRRDGDTLFHEALLVCGVDTATALLMWQGVSAYSDTLQPPDRTNEAGA